MLPLRVHTHALSQTHQNRHPAGVPSRRPVEPRAALTPLELVMFLKYRRGGADRWMRWTGGSTPQRRGRWGRPCGLLGTNEKGALSLEGFLPLSLSLWRRTPVISCPLSERILGIGATWASTERPVSLSVSPQVFLSLICFNSCALVSPCIPSLQSSR